MTKFLCNFMEFNHSRSSWSILLVAWFEFQISVFVLRYLINKVIWILLSLSLGLSLDGMFRIIQVKYDQMEWFESPTCVLAEIFESYSPCNDFISFGIRALGLISYRESRSESPKRTLSAGGGLELLQMVFIRVG